jgi:hypothetical protein
MLGGVSATGHLASDGDREAAADRLRRAAGEGRLQPDELEQRVAEAYRARTVGDLAALTADLPVPAAPKPPAHQRFTSREMRERIAAFVTPNLICIAVWLATGTDGDFWPKWVLLVTGIALLGSLVRTALGVEERDERRIDRPGRRE